MSDKNKGLADNQEGDFVLNESGTSVSIDPVDSDVEGDFVEANDLNEDEVSVESKSDENNSQLPAGEDS